MKTMLIAALELAATPLVAQTAPTTTGQTGKIVMFRGSTVIGAAVGCQIRCDSVELVELGRGKYAEWTVQPGTYTLKNKTANVTVTVAPGGTKYVRCSIKMGFMAGKSDLELVDAERFTSQHAKMERKEIATTTTAAR